MFESDDFDQVLSQLDFPEDCSEKGLITEVQVTEKCSNNGDLTSNNIENRLILSKTGFNAVEENNKQSENISSIASPKHIKRKIINYLFSNKSKRKFPGPAGLLTGTLEQTEDDSICQMELLSQDVGFTQNYLQRGCFETALWARLLSDTNSLDEINTINVIKKQALAGNLLQRKAQTVIGFVESVDRSAVDPLITLRDMTGHMKCTLHRDAWSLFSPYIVSEYCALVLWKPTVLTTGSAYKKHYLNITLNNIRAIYSSTIKNELDESLHKDFIKTCEEEFSIIKSEKPAGIDLSSMNESIIDSDLLDGLDGAFTDDIFS